RRLVVILLRRGEPSQRAGDGAGDEHDSRERHGQCEWRIGLDERFVHCVPRSSTNHDSRNGASGTRHHRGSNSPALAKCAGELAADLCRSQLRSAMTRWRGIRTDLTAEFAAGLLRTGFWPWRTSLMTRPEMSAYTVSTCTWQIGFLFQRCA